MNWQEKQELYFEKEAKEVWICEEDGTIHFYNPSGKLERSELVPDFPAHIAI